MSEHETMVAPTNGAVDVDEEIARLEEERSRRSAERDRVAKLRHLEGLQLEERFERELGPRGDAFELHDAGDGPIVVLKRGPAGVFRKWKLSLKEGRDEANEAATLEFVEKQIAHPSRDEFKELAAKRYGIWEACAKKLLALHSGKEKADAGKA